jgi:hypothetical protein
MARKVSRRPRSSPKFATRADVQEVRALLRQSMADFDALAERFTKVTDIQFERMAQIQAELDEVRTAWLLKPNAKRRKP